MDDLREKVAMSQCSGFWGDDCAVYDIKGSCSDCQKAADRFFAAIEASGYCIVPMEPTPKMVAAGDVYPIVGGSPDDVYRAMLTAYGQGDKP